MHGADILNLATAVLGLVNAVVLILGGRRVHRKVKQVAAKQDAVIAAHRRVTRVAHESTTAIVEAIREGPRH